MSWKVPQRFLCLSQSQNYELLARSEPSDPVEANISQILQNANDSSSHDVSQMPEEQTFTHQSTNSLLQVDSSYQIVQTEQTEATDTPNTVNSSINDTCGQGGSLPLVQIDFGGLRRRTRAYKILSPPKSINQLLVKRRSTRNKTYRNDELAKKIIRGIATNYHKWFLSNITRSVKRGGKASQQRRELLHLLVHLGISQVQVIDWVHNEKECKILDTTFLTVGAKNIRNSLKRESIFNGTKRACIELFKSEIGKALYLKQFVSMWKEFIEKQTDEEAIIQLKKYLHSILECVGENSIFE